MELHSSNFDEERSCENPDCKDEDTGLPPLTEPEQDGDYRYYECPLCGYAFGYIRLEASDDDCAVGIPAEVRRAASGPVQTTFTAQPLLQIGRRA